MGACVLGAVSIAVMTGCSATDPSATWPSDIAGNIVVSADGFDPFEAVDTRNAVVVEERGCISIETDAGERLWVVWPAGARLGATGHTVILADGTEVRDGDRLALTGWITTRSSLPEGDQHDSMWGQSAGFCLGSQKNPAELIIAASVTPRP